MPVATRPSVAIGFTVRDHFHDAAASLRSVFAHTELPYTLYVVDCGIPARYRREMESEIGTRDNVVWIRSASFLYPNQSRNLVLRAATDVDYVAFVENDNVVPPNWLNSLIDACQTTGASIVAPLLFDGPRWLGSFSYHHDRGHGWIRTVREDGADVRVIEADPYNIRRRIRLTAPRIETTLELHCVVARRDLFARIGEFDERLVCTEEVDLSLGLHAAGVTVALDPRVQVQYMPAVWVHADEHEFFFFRWNHEQTIIGDALVAKKWNARNVQDAADFVYGQRYRTNPFTWFAYRVRRIPRRIANEIDVRRHHWHKDRAA